MNFIDIIDLSTIGYVEALHILTSATARSAIEGNHFIS
jgi:hypothetical protein